MVYGRFAHHGPGPLGWLFMILVLAALVVAAVALVRLWQQSRAGARPVGPAGPAVDPAVGELRMRYARGELGWDEFAQRMAGLGYPGFAGAPGSPPAGAAPAGEEPPAGAAAP
jgi:hypothetical protein